MAVHRHRHELVVGPGVEDLLAVPSPPRVISFLGKLVNMVPAQAPPDSITVIINWAVGLEK
jgi:hypothetical protein